MPTHSPNSNGPPPAPSRRGPLGAVRLDLFGGPILWNGNRRMHIAPFSAAILAVAFAEEDGPRRRGDDPESAGGPAGADGQSRSDDPADIDGRAGAACPPPADAPDPPRAPTPLHTPAALHTPAHKGSIAPPALPHRPEPAASRPARIARGVFQRILWRARDEKVIRHRLSQHIYQVNQAMGERLLALDGEHVRVRRDLISCDVADFERAVRDDRFETACDLIERRFLGALSAIPTDLYEDWVNERRIAQRAHLRQGALAAWEAAEEADDWPRASRAAEALLRLDPRGEDGLRRVMRARVMGGQVREAEAVYRIFAERSGTDGSWTPEPETSRLLKSVRDTGAAPAGRAGSVPNPGAPMPFFGRAREIAALTREIRVDSPNAHWHTVAVTGEAGLGKTRLVQELIPRARFRGFRVLRTRSAQLERRIPLGLLLDALGKPWALPFIRSLEDPWRSVLLSLLPEFRGRDGEEIGGGEWHGAGLASPRSVPRKVCEAFLRLFATISGTQRLLFCLDDFHWADEASVTVLEFIRRRWRSGRMTLLIAYCEQEMRGDGLAAGFVRQRERNSEVTFVPLGELDRRCAHELARAAAPEDRSDADLEDIIDMTGGNPRFLIDFASAHEPGGSRGAAIGSVAVPPSVRQLVARRLPELDRSARSVAFGLSVVGSGATVDTLLRMAGCSRSRCLDALDTLHRLRLVDSTRRRVRFRHRIFRHALYDRMSPSRRAVLHGQAAELLASSSGEPQFEEVALHYHRSGNRKLASHNALEAVKRARTGSFKERLRVLRTAYEVSHGPPRAVAAAGLADAYLKLRQLDRALRLGGEALEHAESLSPSESALLRLALAESRHLHGIDGIERALSRVADLEIEVRARGDDGVLAAVLDTTLQLLDQAGDVDGVVARLGGLRELGASSDPAARCRALMSLGMEARYGNPERGLRNAQRAVDAAREAELHDELMLALRRQAEGLMVGGQLATAQGRETLAELRDGAAETGNVSGYALALLGLAEWHTATGGHDAAVPALAALGSFTRSMDCRHMRVVEALARGNLAWAQGDPDEARAIVDAAVSGGAERKAAPDGGDGSAAPIPAVLAGALAGLRGTLHLEAGRLRRARRLAARHPAQRLGHAPLELILFHGRLLSRTGKVPDALRLLTAGAAANEAARPIVWLRLQLERVRLSRRRGSPQPDLAATARSRARALGLGALAHEFVPFCGETG